MKDYPFRLFGVPITTLPTELVLERLVRWLRKEDRVRTIYTPNPEILVRARTNPEYKEILKSGDLLLPDGTGVVFASSFLNGGIRRRITGVDVTENILKYAEMHSLLVCVVLAEEGLTPEAQVKSYFEKRYPNLVINVIVANKYYRKSGYILSDIIELSPDILFVTFGAPEQERWLEKRKNQLKNVRLAFAVGGTFDMLVGTKRRAPKIFRKLYIEWLWRLLQSPKRIIRIFNAIVRFPLYVISDAIRTRFFYRKNVLAFIFRNKNEILMIRKQYIDTGHSFWALPQGGVGKHESEKAALLREIREEVGLEKSIKIVESSSHRHQYKWPWYHRNIFGYAYAGQRQKSYFVSAHRSEKVSIQADGGEPIVSYRWASQGEMRDLIEEKRQKHVINLLNEFNQKHIYERNI